MIYVKVEYHGQIWFEEISEDRYEKNRTIQSDFREVVIGYRSKGNSQYVRSSLRVSNTYKE